MRNPILGMASRDLCNAKTRILGATPGAVPGIDENPHERFSFSPTVGQAVVGIQNWKRAGRRLVEMGGRLPTATALRTSFTKILSKHLAANKKVSFAFQQKSSLAPMMNPSLAVIVDLFAFAEVTLIQHSTVTGHLPGITAANTKVKRRKASKVEVTQEELATKAGGAG